MKNPRKYLELAAQISRTHPDKRAYLFGAVGLRRDGAIVSSTNIASQSLSHTVHCEYRISLKLDKGSIVYLARTKRDLTWANSTPCSRCRAALRRAKVSTVFYTIGPKEFGCLEL